MAGQVLVSYVMLCIIVYLLKFTHVYTLNEEEFA